jgi:hypothetical protein
MSAMNDKMIDIMNADRENEARSKEDPYINGYIICPACKDIDFQHASKCTCCRDTKVVVCCKCNGKGCDPIR